jgi:uncharacterized membrane protein YoaK (UPF0700 family)
MGDVINLLVGIIILILGWLLGELLARIAKEELKAGQKWFVLIVYAGLIGGFISLIFQNDILMFSFFFISIVTSRSLRKRRQERRIKNSSR